MGSIVHIMDEKNEFVKDIDRLARLGVQLVDATSGAFLSILVRNHP